MSYVTTDQLSDRYGSNMLVDLTDRGTPASGAIDTDVVARAVADTAAVIDGHLAKRYTLPLSEVPALITDLAASIAIWKLHIYEPAGKIEADYKEAMRQLAAIAAGTITLPLASGTEAAGASGTGARITDRERPFTEDTMKGFI